MTPEFINLLTQAIASLGFPIFVALWLLIRQDRISRDIRTQNVEIIALLKSLVLRRNSEVPK